MGTEIKNVIIQSLMSDRPRVIELKKTQIERYDYVKGCFEDIDSISAFPHTDKGPHHHFYAYRFCKKPIYIF